MGGLTVGNCLAVVRGALSQPSKLGFTARLAYFNQPRPSIDIDRKYAPMGNISMKRLVFWPN
jgi:hypothetical protein